MKPWGPGRAGRDRTGKAAAKGKVPADIVCVWTSADSQGHPSNSFGPRSPAYLLAAWHVNNHTGLKRERLSVRWDVFRGYHRDVSLLPLRKYHVVRRYATLHVAPRPGTYRLTYTPKLAHMKRGWYSIAARAILKGPPCPRSGCTGQIRQNRFYMH